MTGMFAATLLSDVVDPVAPAPPLPWSGGGRLELGLERRNGKTAAARLFQRAPLRAFLPRHDCGELAVVALANVGGGLVGGDRSEIDIRLGERAAALVTTQAAEKVYRSLGADCRVDTRLAVGDGAWLEWCPQETILFDRARLRRSLELSLHPGGRAMLGENLVLGRIASGERAERGLLHDRIDIRVGGVLRWRDVFRLEGDFASVLNAGAALGGARAVATFAYAATDAADALDTARDLLPTTIVQAGATVVDGVLVARFLAGNPLALRGAFTQFWTGFRAAVAGLPPVLPRLWHV